MRNKSEIKHITKVYNWMVKKGIDLKHFEPSNFIVEEKPLALGFKQNPELIKSKYNHKFMIKRDIDTAMLTLFERVNKMQFDRA